MAYLEQANLHFEKSKASVNPWDLHDLLTCIPDLYSKQAGKCINGKWYFQKYFSNPKVTILELYGNYGSRFYNIWQQHVTSKGHRDHEILREDLSCFLQNNNVIGEQTADGECDICEICEIVLQHGETLQCLKDFELQDCLEKTYLCQHVLKCAQCIINIKDFCMYRAKITNGLDGGYINDSVSVCLLCIDKPHEGELFSSSEPLLKAVVAKLCKSMRCQYKKFMVLQRVCYPLLVTRLAQLILGILRKIQSKTEYETCYLELYEEGSSGQIHSTRVKEVAPFNKSEGNITLENHFCNFFNCFAANKNENTEPTAPKVKAKRSKRSKKSAPAMVMGNESVIFSGFNDTTSDHGDITHDVDGATDASSSSADIVHIKLHSSVALSTSFLKYTRSRELIGMVLHSIAMKCT